MCSSTIDQRPRMIEITCILNVILKEERPMGQSFRDHQRPGQGGPIKAFGRLPWWLRR